MRDGSLCLLATTQKLTQLIGQEGWLALATPESKATKRPSATRSITTLSLLGEILLVIFRDSFGLGYYDPSNRASSRSSSSRGSSSFPDTSEPDAFKRAASFRINLFN